MVMRNSETCSGASDGTPRGPSIGSRTISALVRAYLRNVPIERGKWWLRRKTSPWLVARLDTGPWVRISGLCDFEWAVLERVETSESRTAELFTKLLAPGQVVVDVGANVGYYALTAAVGVGSAGRVVAFEPGPATAERLRENAALNNFSNLTVVQAAVSDVSGTSCFQLAQDCEGSSLYSVGEDTVGSVNARVTTLDSLADELGLDRVDLVKIDAEGAEVAVIRGARHLLSRADSPKVIVEANPATLRAAGESVASLRFEIESAGYLIDVIEAMPWRGELTENWLATKAVQCAAV